MTSNARSFAISTAVMAFFVVGFIAWFSGISNFTCCKRALTAAFFTYVAATLAIRILKIILTSQILFDQAKIAAPTATKNSQQSKRPES